MKRSVAISALFVALSASLFAADEAAKIPVFVKAAQAANGFTDPDQGRIDSRRDLTGKLRSSKYVRVVMSEPEALVVLEVIHRQTEFDQGHILTALAGGRGQKHSSLTVRLTAGPFSAEFMGDGGASGSFSGYAKAADKIVDQFEKWILANRAKLAAMQ